MLNLFQHLINGVLYQRLDTVSARPWNKFRV